MAIKHKKVSAVADDADDSLVRPSDWNDDHEIEPGTIVESMLASGFALVPVGAIVMWSGAIADIPDPWALCDGVANAPGPDLRDKFVVGAKQDEGGVAKTNIEGSLKVTGGVTGHSHSAHANLSHAGGAVGDHTGLTHGLTIGDHPALTHPALTIPSAALAHADHAVASAAAGIASFTNAGPPDHSVASFSGSHASVVGTGVSVVGTAASSAGSHAVATYSVQTGTASRITITPATGSVASVPSVTVNVPSGTVAVPSGTHTHAAVTLTHGALTVAAHSATVPAFTLTHADHSIASASYSIGGTHGAVTHAITAPAAHGVAGTLTHSFTQPDAHAISAHDTVSSLSPYYALAFIQRMAA